MPVSLPPHQWDLLLRCPLFQACPEALVRDVLARSGCSVEDFSSGAEIYRPTASAVVWGCSSPDGYW